MNDILIVIPVYNHASTVRAVALGCLEHHQDVLVVDDGSKDDVAAALVGLDVQLIRHEYNKGKGQAILTAAEYAARSNKTHIITIDADGQHCPGDIPQFIKAAQDDPASIVIGVREFGSSNAPFSSRFGRVFGNFWVRLQTGVRVMDIQSGYRAYPVFVLNNLKYMFRTYAFEDEVIVRALWAGVVVQHLAVSVHYPPRADRVSHFRKFTDNLKLTVLNTYLTMRSVFPWPHRQIQYDNGQYFIVSHPVKILRNSLAEEGHPSRLAMAGALGVFLGALPLIACHTLAIIYVASLLRLNKIVGIATSQICIAPLVPALCIETGYYLRFGKFLTLAGASSLSRASFMEIGYMGVQRIAEWFIGSLVIGPILAVVVGLVIFCLSLSIQRTMLWNESRKAR
jgi:glycosyltransferase involved in cell wall biosynthesis